MSQAPTPEPPRRKADPSATFQVVSDFTRFRNSVLPPQTEPQYAAMTVRNRNRSRSRGEVASLVLALPFSLLLCTGMAQQDTQAPAPIERRPPPSIFPPANPTIYGANVSRNPAPQSSDPQHRGVPPLPRGEHLAQWMNQHSNLTPEQQQRALGQEPGFDNLPSETQQRYRDRLAQLDALNPRRREQFLARTEAMERLNPDQRAEVRGALSQLGQLPPDQRRVVSRTFRALRDLPADQRVMALNSGHYGPPMDAQQRSALFGLLRVEPMLPPPTRPQTVPANPGSPLMPGAQPGYQGPR